MIFGSLADSAWLSFSFATGSLAVTASLPRDTNTHPSVPSNRMPFGNSPLTIILTPSAYSPSVLNGPCTSHSPFLGNSAEPHTSTGPVYSVPIPQWALSMWWAPQPVIIPAPNCSQRSQPGRSYPDCGCTRFSV